MGRAMIWTNGEMEQRKRLIQFLMGLDESYTNVRGQILLMQPLPLVSKAYKHTTSSPSPEHTTSSPSPEHTISSPSPDHTTSSPTSNSQPTPPPPPPATRTFTRTKQLPTALKDY
ncbi:hypothetical protein Tco_0281406 [Tanacetum coccineum]